MVHLSEHFNFSKIFKITISPILMMIFTSLYGVVDGFFIANFAGEDAYAGVNLIMPIIMIIGGFGFMFGTGGSALSAKYLGQQKKEQANNVFTMLFAVLALTGSLISIITFFFIKPISIKMGSITNGTTEGMVNEAIKYGRVLILGQVLFMIQGFFHSYFMVDERPTMGFICTLCAGITNMIFDALFIAVFKWGVVGAAAATIMGYAVGSLIPIIHFITCKTGNINLVKFKIKFKDLGQALFNGSSEFVNNISMSIVSIVFNIQLLKYFGQIGVSAYGTIMYVSFIFIAVFIGYSIGISPVVGYNYGAENKKELKNVLHKSIMIILCIEVMMVLISFFGSPLLAKMFSSGNVELELLSTRSLKIFSFSFIFSGLAIFISSFFTALNNGLISAIEAMLRTLFFQIIFLFVLPLIFGEDGIWFAMVGAELSSLIMGLIFLKANKKKYGY